MKITEGHFTLSDEQRRFKQMVEQTCPPILSYWDFNKRECDVNKLRVDLGKLSRSEGIMAKFFVGVWLGENQLGFDLIDAVRTLNESEKRVILEWMAKPEFP